MEINIDIEIKNRTLSAAWGKRLRLFCWGNSSASIWAASSSVIHPKLMECSYICLGRHWQKVGGGASPKSIFGRPTFFWASNTSGNVQKLFGRQFFYDIETILETIFDVLGLAPRHQVLSWPAQEAMVDEKAQAQPMVDSLAKEEEVEGHQARFWLTQERMLPALTELSVPALLSEGERERERAR